LSVSHLDSLEQSLAQRGWRVVAIHTGDGVRISASWEIQRSTKQPTLIIDFDGLEPDGGNCLPLEESYGCRLRGHAGFSLYFRRKMTSRREFWNADLESFLDALDEVAIRTE
jgi:hypothetical protein